MNNKDFINSFKKLLSKKLKEVFSVETDNIKVEFPVDASFGDFTTNVALTLAGSLKKSPRDIANEIINSIDDTEKESLYINSLEVAGNGFINIKLKDSFAFENFVLIDEGYGKLKKENPKRIMVESGQPNTHKIPHIGHLYSYIVGDSIGRILDANGDTVKKVNYQGDVGPHVAKCIYAWIKKDRPIPNSLHEKVTLLQECYQIGSKAYEEDENAKKEIQEINKKIYLKDESVIKDWETTRQWSLDFYKEFEELLGIDQSMHYLESNIWERGYDLVKKNTGKIFEESEGAIIFKGENYGLHTRVFITKQDTPTYEAKDIGLNTRKYEDWEYDLNIITTANETLNYFKVIFEALTQIAPYLKGKLLNVPFGMVQLSTGKMSSRTGNIITGPGLIELVEEKVNEIMKTREDLTEEEKKEISKKISIGAIKYSFLKSNILNNLKFDINESISFDGNSGPYIQYTYTRIHNLLDKDSSINTDYNASTLEELLNTEEEINLIKHLTKYEGVVYEAGSTYSPHKISSYLFILAQLFNKFYTNLSVNSAQTPELKNARRILVEKTGIILKNGLYLLGIETLKKM